jgi:MFS family permease
MTDLAARPTPLGVRAILRIREYRLLWTGQLISDAGDAVTNFALLLLVNALTGSTAALAAMAIVLAIPSLTIGLVAGTYVDRVDRRRIMLASDLLRALFVLGFIAVGSASTLWLLYLLAFVQATIGTFFTPARGALMPRVVPPEGLLAANSLTQATRVVAFVTGAGLAGFIVGTAGQFWPAFVLDSASFVASFLLIVRLPAAIGRISVEARAAAAGTREALLAGVRTVARSRTLSTTIAVLAVVMLGGGAVNVLYVPVVVRVLDAGPAWLGPLEFAQGASMILATGLIAKLASRFRPSTIVTVGVGGMAVLVALIGATTAIWQLLVLSFAIGWFISPAQAAVVTILQQGTPDQELGRVMAVLQAAMSATSVLSMAFAGIAGDAFGIREAFFAAGAIVAGGFVLAVIGYRGRAAEPTAQPPNGDAVYVG